MTPAIILRDAIAVDDSSFPKGLIMPWPHDMELPLGMVWLRELVFVPDPAGNPQMAWGDFTPEAKLVMQEIARKL